MSGNSTKELELITKDIESEIERNHDLSDIADELEKINDSWLPTGLILGTISAIALLTVGMGLYSTSIGVSGSYDTVVAAEEHSVIEYMEDEEMIHTDVIIDKE